MSEPECTRCPTLETDHSKTATAQAVGGLRAWVVSSRGSESGAREPYGIPLPADKREPTQAERPNSAGAEPGVRIESVRIDRKHLAGTSGPLTREREAEGRARFAEFDRDSPARMVDARDALQFDQNLVATLQA